LRRLGQSALVWGKSLKRRPLPHAPIPLHPFAILSIELVQNIGQVNTMATLMLEGGADIRFIQAMLGHADLKTTQIYTQVSIRQLQEIHRATHPAKLERDRNALHRALEGEREDDV
jgi:hypothetical protein